MIIKILGCSLNTHSYHPSQPATTHDSTLTYSDHTALELRAGLRASGMHTPGTHPATVPTTSIIRKYEEQKERKIYTEMTRKVQAYTPENVWKRTYFPNSKQEKETENPPSLVLSLLCMRRKVCRLTTKWSAWPALKAVSPFSASPSSFHLPVCSNSGTIRLNQAQKRRQKKLKLLGHLITLYMGNWLSCAYCLPVLTEDSGSHGKLWTRTICFLLCYKGHRAQCPAHSRRSVNMWWTSEWWVNARVCTMSNTMDCLDTLLMTTLISISAQKTT